jgi:hypothetical protein
VTLFILGGRTPPVVLFTSSPAEDAGALPSVLILTCPLQTLANIQKIAIMMFGVFIENLIADILFIDQFLMHLTENPEYLELK